MDKYISAKLDSFNFSKSQKELFVDIITYVATKAIAGGIDLSNFATKDDLHNSVHGLELDINTVRDTAVEANRIANNNIDEINNINDNIIPNFYTKTETDKKVDNRIQQVVGAAPEALDTLEEIADRLKDDSDAITAINGVLEGKVNNTAFEDSIQDINSKLSTKVNNTIFEEYKDTVFTKDQVDSLFNDFTTNVNNNLSEIRNKVNTKANSDDVYTKTEISATVNDLVNTFDTKLDNKANTTDIKTTIESLDDVYLFPGNINNISLNTSNNELLSILGNYSDVKKAIQDGKIFINKYKSNNINAIANIVAARYRNNKLILQYFNTGYTTEPTITVITIDTSNNSYSNPVLQINFIDDIQNNKNNIDKKADKTTVYTKNEIDANFNSLENNLNNQFNNINQRVVAAEENINKKADITALPTKISDLTRDDLYIINTNLVNSIINNEDDQIINTIGNINNLRHAIDNNKRILCIPTIISNADDGYKYNNVEIFGNIYDRMNNNIYSIMLCCYSHEWLHYVALTVNNSNVQIIRNNRIYINLPIDNVTTNLTATPLSAKQGLILNNKITELSNKIAPISNIYQFEDFIPLINGQINTLSNDVIYSLVQAVYKQYLIITSLNNSSSIIIISCKFNNNTFTNLSNGDVNYTGYLSADCIIDDETYAVCIPVNNNQLDDSIEVYKHFEGISSELYSLEKKIHNNGGSGL